MRITPLVDAPILHADDDARLEGNVNGPSLVRAPDFAGAPLGTYYLYFAHHLGKSIRLATADSLAGPWSLHAPGALSLAESLFPTEPPAKEDLSPAMRRIVDAGLDLLYPHVASPDVVVVDDLREVRMYYHGRHADGSQRTRVAVSRDGLRFTAREELLGDSYFRVFRHRDAWYALAMPGRVLRSRDGLGGFEPGPLLFDRDMRHGAVRVVDDHLQVLYTRAGDAPERILCATIDLAPDWRSWRESAPVEVRRPERPWEGADLPVRASRRGAALAPVNELRDPALFEEDGRVYVVWSVAGERGLAIGRLEDA